MTEDMFIEQISPIPDHDYVHFVKADMRLGQYAFSRAYINFTQHEDLYLFKEKFDDYVFLDTKGNEYPAIVEYAPFQKIPKKRNKKRDSKCGTISNDPEYLNFLESMKNPEDITLPTAEIYLEEIETREKELKANNGVPKMTTPLIEYLRQRKIEQQKIREEKREERKRKEIEKKRLREEERRRRKAEKDRSKEKFREKESHSEKETMEEVEESSVSEDLKQSEPIVQVLKNPEREKDPKEIIPPQKSKDYYVSTRVNKDKERSKRDWERETERAIQREREKIRTKERQRINERQSIARDKDRSRRDKIEHKSYAASKKDQTESHSKIEEPADNVSTYSPKKNSKDLRSEASSESQGPEDKWTKNKRDNSCPGNVESLGSRNQRKESTPGKQFTSSSKNLNCEASAENNENFKSDSNFADYGDQSKDPKVEKRIRNKDRPSLEIYRPGMRRFSTQRNSPQKEISTSTSNSSTPSPSPTPPLTTSGTKIPTKENDKTKNRKMSVDTDGNVSGKEVQY